MIVSEGRAASIALLLNQTKIQRNNQLSINLNRLLKLNQLQWMAISAPNLKEKQPKPNNSKSTLR
jgi:hypothetical protein